MSSRAGGTAMRDISKAFAEAKLLADRATERAMHEPLAHAVKPVAVERPHYMLRVVPNREVAVEERLLNHGMSVFLPTETKGRKTGWNRRRQSRVAIFYGTMFVPDFDADLRRLKTIADGIIGFHRWNNEQPIVVSPRWMAEIRAFARWCDVPPSQRKRRYEVGDDVYIHSGPFAMFMGNLVSLDSQQRLTVVVNVFGRMTPVTLDEDQVEAV